MYVGLTDSGLDPAGFWRRRWFRMTSTVRNSSRYVSREGPGSSEWAESLALDTIDNSDPVELLLVTKASSLQLFFFIIFLFLWL